MSDAARVSFLGARCPSGLRVRTLALQPGDAMDYLASDWTDSIVVVERGELRIECHSGACASFAEGAVLVLSGLALRRLVNPGVTTVVLTAVSRTHVVE